MDHPSTATLFAAWLEAERDVCLLRDVSLDEAEMRAAFAKAAYLGAIGRAMLTGQAQSLDPLGVARGDVEEDVTWPYEVEWAP